MELYSGYSFNYSRLVYLILVLLPLFLLAYRLIKDRVKAMFFILFTLGFVMYSGIGYTFETGVHKNYLVYFSVFIYTFGLLYFFFTRLNLFSRFNHTIAENRVNNLIYNKTASYIVFTFYIFTFFVDLIIPEFKLHYIFNPPSPDIISNLTLRFDSTNEVTFVNTLTRYSRTLLYPFYLLFLTRYAKNNLKAFIFLLLFPLYLEYCVNEYIGRSAILLSLLFGGFLVYRVRLKARKLIILFGASALPFIILLSYFYQFARLGNADMAEDINTSDAIEAITNVEFGFPTLSETVISSTKRINLVKYHLWILTLPIPKFGVFRVDGAYPAYDISELVTGVDRNSSNFNVVLSGFLTESIYVYGTSFFWINACLLAFFIASFANFLSKIPSAYAFAIFISLAFGYNFNRAGIQSALPLVTSFLLPFYIYAFFLINNLKLKL